MTASIQAKAGAPGRNFGIDALRASVTLLVVLHHTSITYGASGGWYYKEIAPSQTPAGLLLTLFTAVNQAWFMGLFFLLAGYFTPPAYDRRGAAGFVRERLLRLGVPLLAYALLLHPLTVAIAATARGGAFGATFLAVWAQGRFEPGPLWFAEALLIFAIPYLLWRASFPARRESPGFPSNAALLAAALVTGAVAFLLRLALPVGVNVAFLQLGYFASYIVLFVAGCLGADRRWLEHIPQSQKRLWLRIAWLALPVLPVLALVAPHVELLAGKPEGGWNVPALVYAFWEPFVAWGFIMGLLVFFQRRLAAPAGIWPSLARRAFLIYIIHPPIVVAASIAWRGVDAPALLKFAITGAISCALCYLAAGLLLRIPAIARIV